MKNHLFVSPEGPKRSLIVFFTGWGMDLNPFTSLTFDTYDTMVVWDYSDTEPLPVDIIQRYDEICVFAWSFGVVNAHRFISDNRSLPITLRVAVNGTLFPVDSERGIPQAIYEGTLRGFSEPTLDRFRRRMCGSKERYDRFMLNAPQRTLGSLRNELQLMSGASLSDSLNHNSEWDVVVIGTADRIFPPMAQRRGWEGHPNIVEVDEPHLLDNRALMLRFVIDKDSVARHFRNSALTYADNATVQRRMADELLRLLPAASEARIDNILEVGCGSGYLTSKLKSLYPDASLRMWDLAPCFEGVEQCDAEISIRNLNPESLDLIVSSATVQWFHSPTGFLAKCYEKIVPGGYMAFSTFGPANFREIASVTGLSLKYMSLAKWRATALSQGWSIMENFEVEMPLHFTGVADILRHLRLTGVNSLGNADANPIAATRRLLSDYPASESGEGYDLTYNPLFMVLRKL